MEKPIPYQPPLPPNEARSGVDAAAGVTPVALRPPFVTPAAAHSHPDCRGIPILIVALQIAPFIPQPAQGGGKKTVVAHASLPSPVTLGSIVQYRIRLAASGFTQIAAIRP